MKKILIPYDFSEASVNALNFANSFFNDIPCEIHLIHVYKVAPSYLLSDEQSSNWNNEIDNEVEVNLNNIVIALNKAKDSKITYSSSIKYGSFIDAIQIVQKEFQCNLILSGTKGAHGLREVFIGSNTLKLIKNIWSCPILVIPDHYKFKKLSKIVFSTSYLYAYTKIALKEMVWLSVVKELPIEVAHLTKDEYLSDKQMINKNFLSETLEDTDVIFKKIDWVENETESIEFYINNSLASLLVLMNHKQSFFNKLTSEDVIKKVSFHSKIPLLILPEKK